MTENYNDTIDTVLPNSNAILALKYYYGCGKEVKDRGFDKETGGSYYIEELSIFLIDSTMSMKDFLNRNEWGYMKESNGTASYILIIDETDFE